MMILSEHGNYQPPWQLQTWLLVRLIAVQLGSDLRWGLLALALNLAGRRLGLRPPETCIAWAGPHKRAAESLLTPWWQQASASVCARRSKEPEMITLFGFGAGFGLPEMSPFVTKTEVQLRMAGLAYRKEKAMPPASPKGQLPYIEDEAERIADSTFIRAHIEGKYGFDFDAPLSLQQRAQAWAFERMIEHHVYWALIGARWVNPENFAKGPAHFFDRVPEHQRDKVREDAQFRVAENYLLSGLGRHGPDEDVDLAVRSLFALSVQLGDKSYLMGEEPCGTDATAFGALAGILTPFFDSSLARADGKIRQPHRLCRPDDGAILSGVRLEAAAAGACAA